MLKIVNSHEMMSTSLMKNSVLSVPWNIHINRYNYMQWQEDHVSQFWLKFVYMVGEIDKDFAVKNVLEG